MERSFKYWCKIKHDYGSLAHTMLVEQNIQNCRNSWSFKIKAKLDTLGLGDVWINADARLNFYATIQRRIRDQYIQSWNESLTAYPKLQFYSKFKKKYEFESYLVNIKNEKLLHLLIRFRISAHKLSIEQGRYQGVNRNERICRMCNDNFIENEYHFLLTCPKYKDLRNKYFRNTSWPTIDKFSRILSSENKNLQIKTAIYLQKAFERRELSMQ